MKSIRFRLFLAALAVLLGGAIAKSQTADTAPPPPPTHAMPSAWRPHDGLFAKYLNLTDDSAAQMKAVMQKEQPTLKPLIQQTHQMEQQLKPYEEGTYDETKVQPWSRSNRRPWCN
jgi:Spy/CpxP family protein refolding chaperone